MVTRVFTFYANIYVGCKNVDTKEVFSIDMVRNICRNFVDEKGLCVTVTPTEYIYTGGGETGAIVGLINYPRFPSDEKSICGNAMELAKILKDRLKQHRVSIMTPNETVMIGDDE